MHETLVIMRELRLQIAEARASLRASKDNFDVVRAAAEQRAIEGGLATGKNADERARSLALALEKDERYQVALAGLRATERHVDRLDALLESARDERRADEWRIRAQLAAALERAGVQSDGEEPAGDGVFDDVLDHMSSGHLERSSYANQPRPQPTYAALGDDDYPF